MKLLLTGIQWLAILIDAAAAIAADPASGAGNMPSEFPGKPQAPIVLHWSTGTEEGRLEATLTPLRDFDELRVELHIPGENRPYEIWRFQDGHRGENLVVSWDGVSQSGLPRLLVKVWSGNQSSTRTLAQPLDSERAFKSWQEESRRLESRRRMDRQDRLVILPAQDNARLP